MLRFALKFVLCFAALMSLFEASRGTVIERLLVEECILKPATALIRLLSPSEHVALAGRTITSTVVHTSTVLHLHIIRGCEGIEIFLLLVSAVLAFPAGWRARLHGLAVGFVLAYLLSLGRLVALYFTLSSAPGAWEALHGLLLPLGPIIVISLYFMHWSGTIQLPNTAAPGSHAP
jgi:exosortase/archaeosortase family protein